MVVLTAFLVHKGSHESKDQDEKVERTLARIEQRLGRNEAAQAPRVAANGPPAAEAKADVARPVARRP